MSWKPYKESKRLLDEVIAKFEAYDDRLTTKQLYYILLNEGIIEDHSVLSFRKLQGLLINARKHGFLYPQHEQFNIEDNLQFLGSEVNDYLEHVLQQYSISLSTGQDNLVEVWTDNKPVYNYLSPLLEEYGVRVVHVTGWANHSLLYTAYLRLSKAVELGMTPRIIYLCDFSSINYLIYENVVKELASFFKVSYQEMNSIVFLAGILPEQVIRFDIEKSFEKVKNRRAHTFIAKYSSVLTTLGISPVDRFELEALDPKELEHFVLNIVSDLVDLDQLEKVKKLEVINKEKLRAIIKSHTTND